ncbi:unnamed protein product [Callosobruchus maculatus]|uniref:Neurotransmitter-gated ion-channel ligand-binding domain-containing protein n=1 Tax=Callosobruchus maculatus TaxID=64391 RepID=A0A653C8K7_CALMS|nr:unnamed protein product [Callosobruchus maculatus]
MNSCELHFGAPLAVAGLVEEPALSNRKQRCSCSWCHVQCCRIHAKRCPNMGQPWLLVRVAALLFIVAIRNTIALSDIFEEGKSDKEILDQLLLATRYDKRLLPPVRDADFCCGLQSPEDGNGNGNSTVNRKQPAPPFHNGINGKQRESLTVNVSVLLLSLASPDESSLKYEVEFLLQQQWYDPRLRYSNQSQYPYLNAIHHHSDIWLPDTYFIMHGDFKDPLIPVHFSLKIYRNGSVTYLMRRHLILSCQGSLNIFPFDDPKCTFSMESISYEMTSMRYVWKNDEDVLRKSPSLTTLNAYLIANATLQCPTKSIWRGNYSCLRVELMFTRDRAFYFTTVFIPGIILVTSSFITFWLEWNAVPARVMIACWSSSASITLEGSGPCTTSFIGQGRILSLRGTKSEILQFQMK